VKLVTSAQMRAIEAAVFASGVTPAALMETAGLRVAEAVRGRLGDARARRIAVLVGPGNNGGDGLVAARHLHDFGADVSVYLLAPRPADDPNLELVRQRDIEVLEVDEAAVEARLRPDLSRADAVIDAVLGTGRQRPLAGAMAAALQATRLRRGLLFALDLPSGVDPDSGEAQAAAVAADVTLTLGFSKLGLHLLPGSAHAGRVEVLDIGIDPALAADVNTELMTPDWAREALPDRPLVANKGTFGRVLAVAGSESYTGAAALACLGALRAGAGLVTLACLPAVRYAVASRLAEPTYLVLPAGEDGPAPAAADAVAKALPAYDVLLVGPGLGLSEGAKALVRELLSSEAVAPLPVVIDADALNSLAGLPGWHRRLRCRAVLTPHPGELSRLTGASVAEIQAGRVDRAREHAGAWKQTLVLKGAQTVVAAPDGSVRLSPFANPALATAGTGDVLAGAIAGLAAQGLDPAEAAALGVYLHAAAADVYEAEYGAAGLLASEVAAGIARAAAKLRRGEA